MKKNVSILIPTWNGINLLAKYIPSILKASKKLDTLFKEIIIIDDCSSDHTEQFIKKKFPSISLFRLSQNKGFHYAVNYGMNKATTDIVILLNSDIEAEENSFASLIQHFQNDNLFGVSGRIYSDDKKTFLYGNRGGYFKNGHFHLYEKDEFATSQNLFVCGGAGAFCRKKFLALGGFDTLYYPFYYEEQDISYRALKRGWDIAYEPKSIMYHEVSTTISKKAKRKKISYISARNNYLFCMKNITDINYTIEMIFFIPLFLLKDLLKFKLRFWIAFLISVPRIPIALIKRIKEQTHYIKTDKEIFYQVNKKN